MKYILYHYKDNLRDLYSGHVLEKGNPILFIEWNPDIHKVLRNLTIDKSDLPNNTLKSLLKNIYIDRYSFNSIKELQENHPELFI